MDWVRLKDLSIVLGQIVKAISLLNKDLIVPVLYVIMNFAQNVKKSGTMHSLVRITKNGKKIMTNRKENFKNILTGILKVVQTVILTSKRMEAAIT